MDPARDTRRIASTLRRLDRIIWAVIAAVAAIVLTASAISSFPSHGEPSRRRRWSPPF